MKRSVKAPTRGHDSFSSVSLREGKGEFKRAEKKRENPNLTKTLSFFLFLLRKTQGEFQKM